MTYPYSTFAASDCYGVAVFYNTCGMKGVERDGELALMFDRRSTDVDIESRDDSAIIGIAVG